MFNPFSLLMSILLVRSIRAWQSPTISRLQYRHSLLCLYSTKRIVYLGTPEVAATTLSTLHDASLDQNWEVVSVVTQPPTRRRRKGDKLEPSPVGKTAELLGIPVLTPQKANDPQFLDALQDLQPDLCITAAYGQYLPKRFLATPTAGTVNIHPSLLPKWRGASPVQRSLQAGDNPVGVTVLYTVSKMDAGPIISQISVPIEDTETSITVLPKLFEIGTNELIRVLPDILSGQITSETATPQDDEQATAAPLITTSESELKVWNQTARECHNQNRGFAMWPQTYLWIQPGDREPIQIKVLETRVPVMDPIEPVTNTITVGPTKQDGLYVTCFDGSVLELLKVQPATKKAFAARDLQNGYPGETLRWIRQIKDDEESSS
jgi:methionyl-tRNA formyltransferase